MTEDKIITKDQGLFIVLGSPQSSFIENIEFGLILDGGRAVKEFAKFMLVEKSVSMK